MYFIVQGSYGTYILRSMYLRYIYFAVYVFYSTYILRSMYFTVHIFYGLGIVENMKYKLNKYEIEIKNLN